MGIRGLLPFLKKKINMETIQLSELNSQFCSRRYPVICIDFNQFLYKYLYEYNTYFSRRYVKNQYIQSKFAKLIEKFQYFKIDLIFVMDGIPQNDKKYTIEKRKTKSTKIPSHSSFQDDKKIISIEFEDCDDMEKYFIRNKIKYIHNDNYEADLICKWLVEHNIADYALSNDTDLLAYGCRHVLYDFDFVNNTVVYINYDEMLEQIDLTPSQFLDLCIGCGTDYNSRFTHTELIYKLIKYQIDDKYVYPDLQCIVDDVDNICSNIAEKLDENISILCKPKILDYQKVLAIYNYQLSNDVIQHCLKMGRV